MKRIVYTLSLALGVSVASYAGVITTAAGNLTGAGTATIDFENATSFPLGSFSSLPFNFAGNTVTVSSATGSGGTYDTGGTAAIGSGAAGYGPGLASKYVSTFGGTGGGAYNFSGGLYTSNNFTRTLTFTFTNSVSDFIIGYFGNDANQTPGGTFLAGLSTVTFGTGAGAQTTTLANEACIASGIGANCNTAGSAEVGYRGDSTLASFKVVTFTFTGADQGSLMNGDQVLFDNLRVFNAGTPDTTVTTTTTTIVVPPSGVPEPSTYALIGAGLVGLAFARRKK